MSRSVRRGAVLLAVALLATGAVGAGEVIHFNNGGVLAIQSHKVEGDMVRVTLGTNATLVFPLSLVDRVEIGGRTVFSSAGPANVVPGTDRGVAAQHQRDYPATGDGAVPSRFAAQPDRQGDPGWSANMAAPESGDPSVLVAPNSPARAIGRPSGRATIDRPTLQPGDSTRLPPGGIEGRPPLVSVQPVMRPPATPPAVPPAVPPAPEAEVPEPEAAPPEPEPVPDPPSDGDGA